MFTAKAPGHLERTERVPVVAGEMRNVELSLAREKVEAPKPKTPVIATSGINDWSGWKNEDGQYVRKGGNRVRVHSGPLNGTFSFTAKIKGGGIFRGPKLRCFIDDGSSVSQIEIDRKKADADDKLYHVQIEVTPDHIIQRAKIDDRWVVVGNSPGRNIPNGHFGFVIPGGDEVIISNFHFTPNSR